MKIAMMTNNYKPFIGGVPISVERLAEGLRKQGHEVVVFAPAYKAQLKEEGVMRYHSVLEGIAGGVVIPNSLDPRIEKRFREGAFDIIHVHHPIAIGNTAAYLSRKYKVPMVFTYHTRYEQYLHYVKPVMWMEKGALKGGKLQGLQKEALSVVKDKVVPGYLKSFLGKCNHIFAPTKGMEEYLTEVCGVEDDRISVLPTGLREESYHGELQNAEEIRKDYQATDCPLFITVARLAHEKNIAFLLRALACFKTMFQKPFKMLLVGDGPERAEYEKMARDLQLEQEVIFTGLLANEVLPDYYRAADLFLFASRTETQGIVILESMAAETPVIAVNATGISDLVENGVNGYLVEEDIMEFAFFINQTLADKNRLAILSENAFQTAFDFREDNIARKAANIYEVIIQRNHEKQQNSFQMMAEGANLLSEL